MTQDPKNTDLIDQLAQLDEQPGTSSEPTLQAFKAELDTLAGDLRAPAPENPYEQESACRRANDLVRAIGQEPSYDTRTQALTPAVVDESELGDLGQYRLMEKLGEGGMGAVYKARHQKLNKIVALKVLPANRLQDTAAVKRFEREMQAVGQLEHPNIVRAMDAGDIDGKHYLVMELVKGIDLSALLRLVGPLNPPDACEMIRQAALGIEEAHEHGMVHRDIKPSNLMLAQVGRGKKPPAIKILDMGLALLDERTSGTPELTSTGQLMGTVDYMAPEQGLNTHGVDIRADIYSLGATLFKLLTGRVVFADDEYDTLMKKMMALGSKPAVSIGEVRPDLPEPLVVLIDRLLAKNPDDRPGTPGELAQALAAFTTGHDLARLLGTATDVSGRSVQMTESEMAGPTAEMPGSDPTATPLVPAPQPVRIEPTMDVSDVSAAPAPAPAATPPRSRRPLMIGGAAGGLLILLGVLLTISFGKGTVVVEGPDGQPLPDDIRVVVQTEDGDPVVIVESKNGWRAAVRSGPIRIDLQGDSRDKFQVEEGTLTVSRLGETIVKVSRRKDPDPDDPTPPGSWSRGSGKDVWPGLIAQPTALPGIRRWQVETTHPRGYSNAWFWSPDGNHIAAADHLGNVRIFKANTMELTAMLMGHKIRVTKVAWSRDGHWLATRDHSHELRTWRSDGTPTGLTLPSMNDADWSPDGETLVLCSIHGTSVRRRDGEKISDVSISNSKSVAWSPDGRTIAVGTAFGKVQLITPDGNLGAEFECGQLAEYLSWSPDGRILAIGALKSGKLWWPRDNKSVALNGMGANYGFAWSPDGQHLVAGGAIWNLDGSPTQRVTYAQAWNHEGIHSVNIEAVGSDAVRRIWDHNGKLAEDPKGVLNLPRIQSLTWSRDGKFLAVGEGDSVQIWDEQAQLCAHLKNAKTSAWGPKSEIAVGDGQKIGLYSTDGKLQRSMEASHFEVLWSRNGNQFALALGAQLNKGTPESDVFTPLQISAHMAVIELSPDGSLAAGVELSGKMHVIDLLNGESQLTKQAHDGRPLQVGWNTKGDRFFTAGNDRKVRIWSTDGTAGESFDGIAAAWSPDDSRLAVLTIADDTWLVRVHDSSGHVELEFPVPEEVASTIAWSPDGLNLALAGATFGTVSVRDADSGNELWTAVTLDSGKCASFNPGGELLSGSYTDYEDELIYVVETMDGRSVALSPVEFHEWLIYNGKMEGTPRGNQLGNSTTAAPGPRRSALPGVASQPAVLPGIHRWQVEKRNPRGGFSCPPACNQNGQIAVGTSIGMIYVYNNVLELTAIYPGHTEEITNVEWSPDGTWLGSSSEDGTLRLWKNDGTIGPVFHQNQPISDFAWSPDGERLVSVVDAPSSLQFWNSSGRPEGFVPIGEAHGLDRVEWSPRGDALAVTKGNGTLLCDAHGKNARPLEGLPGSYTAFSPNGKWLCAVTKNTTRFIPVDGGDTRDNPNVEARGYPVWTSDNSVLVSTHDKGLASLNTDGRLVPLGLPDDRKAYNANGPLFVLGHRSALKLVVQKGKIGITQEFSGPQILSMDWADGGDRLIGALVDDHCTPILSEGGKPVGFIAAYRLSKGVDWHPDGKRVVVTNYDHDQEGKFSRKSLQVNPGNISAVAWNAAGDRLAIVAKSGVWLFGSSLQEVFHESRPNTYGDIAWNSDGSQFVTAFDGLNFRDRDGKLLASYPDVYRNSPIDWGQHGLIAVAGRAVIQIFRSDGGLVREIQSGHQENLDFTLNDLAWRPESNDLASVGYDHTVRIWDENGELKQELKAGDRVNAIGWSSDGKHLVTGDHAGTIRTWDVDAGRQVWVAVPVKSDASDARDRSVVTFSAAGEFLHGESDAVDDEFVYIVETSDGKVELQTPQQFRTRVGR